MTKQTINSSKKNKRKGTISLEEFVALEQELTKAKLECQESHNRFEALFEMTNDAIFLIDSETQKFILANKKAAELLGFKIEDTANYTAKDFIVTGEEENSDECIEQLLKDKVLPIYERTFVKKNGEQFIAEVNLSLIKDSSTGRTIIQSIVRDISERKRLENYLLRDREIYYRIANAAIKTTDIPGFCNSVLTDLITYLDFDIGTLRVYNRKTDLLELLAVIGLPLNLFLELKPMKLSDKHYIISESLQKKIPIFAPNTDEEPSLTKYRERLKMFNIKSLISWPILDKSDNIIGALQLSAREPKIILAEDKRFFESIANMLANAIRRFFAEEDLQEAFKEQEELNKIINLSPAIVFLWKNEENWPVEFVSENVMQFGYSPEEFYNGKILFSSIIHPDDLVKVTADTAQISSDTKASKMYQQYRIITKTGEVRWINDYSRIRRDSEGKITHFNGILIDISNRKRAELALQNERKVYQIIADAAAISTNVPELSQYILNGLIEIFKFDVGSIRIYEPETKLLIPYAHVRFEEITGREIKPISINEPNLVISLVARTKQPLFAPNIAKSNLAENYLTALAEIEISSLITWPILSSDNELLGVLQLAAEKPKDIPKTDEIVFETIAGTLSNAIDRLLVQEAKQESDEKFRAFAEQTLTGICLFNQNGKILFVNKYIEAITEYSSNELVGLNLFNNLGIIFPKNNLTSDNVQQEVLELLTSPTTFEFELKIKSGLIKWVSINITPTKIRDEIVFSAMMVDINQRKNSQLALQREREILTIISEATANNVHLSDLCQDILEGMLTALGLETGTCRLLNRTTNSLDLLAKYGLNEGEKHFLYNISLDDNSHPLVKSGLFNEKRFVIDTDLDKEMKNKPIVKDYKYKVYISWPIINANKEYLGKIQLASKKHANLSEDDKAFFDPICEIIATSIDHLKALEELRESELKFKRTVENISDGIMIIKNQELIYINNQAEKIFGYTFEEISEMEDFSFVNADDRSKYEKNRDEVREKQSPSGEEEYWFTRKDGFSRCINNRHSMIIKDDGSYSLYIVTRDITERKLAENALQKLNDELEERVKERTIQLERLNKELEAFSYSVSHDLRTPLRSVDGFSQVLLDDYTDKLDDVGRDYLRRIRAASKRMSDLIDDLLALTQLTRKDFQSQKIDLSKMVAKILTDFQDNDPERKIKINIEKNLIVYGDSVLIQTVMENLIGNAWKFSSKKEKTIIKLGSKVINNEKVYYLSDNGDGFDMAYANKLFAVFQRLHTEKEFTGTGIGLAIVQRILNRHGGRIWAKSQPGKGATFYFTIGRENEPKRSS